MAKKLTIFMIDDTEFGPRTAEIGNWVGKAIYTNRASLQKILDRKEFDNPGVYFLKSSPNSDAFSERIYIGEAENIRARIKQHLSEKRRDFEELIFFISKDELLTKTQVKFLEAKIIKMALEAKAAEIENGNNPKLPTLHEADIADMDYFLNNIKLILPLMNFRFLIPMTVKTISEGIATEPSRKIFHIKSSHIVAHMYESKQGFIVVKGSQAKLEMAKMVSSTYKNLQKKMIDTGILIRDGMSYKFVEDTIFSSPSSAANIVLGRQSPGPLNWLDESNKSYKQLTVEGLI